jgi:hypothetical protein
MVLMSADPLFGQVGRGWALENLDFFGPQLTHFTGPKKYRFPGPTPLPLALVMELHASKTLCTGPYK